MTHPDRARYRDLVEQRPELFLNPPDGGFYVLVDDESIAAVDGGVVYEDDYVVLLRDAVAFPDGRVGPYIRLVGPRGEPWGVAVLPIHEGEIVLLRHFRHATRSHHWEIPRGFSIAGMTAEAVARRELEEELGIERAELTPLGVMHTNTGLSSESVALFVAGVSWEGRPNRGEGIDASAAVSVAEMEQMIRAGDVTDSFTLAAYARARLLGLLPG